MENQNPQPVSNQTVPPQQPHSSRIVFILIAVILLGFAGFGGFMLGMKTSVSPSTQIGDASLGNQTSSSIPTPSEKNGQWLKPASSQQGYPVEIKADKENTRTLSIYSFTTKKLTPVNFLVDSGGGASGFGQTDPLVSPNLLYTAAIDTSSKNLMLISNETLQSKNITNNGSVAYISAWSPDSKKIIYYTSDDTIMTRTMGQGGPPNKVTFKPSLETGFFIFNIDTGETTKLYPIADFENFIDNDRILVQSTDQSFKDHLIVFNTKTFEADYSFVKDTFGYGVNQFTFSNDGSKWAFYYSKNPSTDGNIAFGPFPQKDGIIVDAGQWAETQFPLVSPTGNKVAFSRRDFTQSDGVPNYSLWVYDATTKQKTKYNVEGWAKSWIDENSLIVKASNASKTNINIIDLRSGNITKTY